MRLTIHMDGGEVDVNGFLDKKGVKNSKSQIQETLDKNIDKGKKGEPMQDTLDRKLAAKKRVGVQRPSQQRSKAQSNMKDAWPSPDDVAKFMDGQA